MGYKITKYGRLTTENLQSRIWVMLLFILMVIQGISGADEDKDCTICLGIIPRRHWAAYVLDLIIVNDWVAYVVPCGSVVPHTFHRVCASDWIIEHNHNTCPTCRVPLPDLNKVKTQLELLESTVIQRFLTKTKKVLLFPLMIFYSILTVNINPENNILSSVVHRLRPVVSYLKDHLKLGIMGYL